MTSHRSGNAAWNSWIDSHEEDLMRSGPKIRFLGKSQAQTSAGCKPNIWIIISGNLGCDDTKAGG